LIAPALFKEVRCLTHKANNKVTNTHIPRPVANNILIEYKKICVCSFQWVLFTYERIYFPVQPNYSIRALASSHFDFCKRHLKRSEDNESRGNDVGTGLTAERSSGEGTF